MIPALLSPFADRAYAVLRIVAGVMFAFHGVQKIFGVLTDHQPPVGSQLWIGGLIEIGAGTLIAAGFQASWAAFLASGMMAVAYVQYHWKFSFDERLLPAVNRGEMAVLYCFLFLFVACRGAGPWSVDARRAGGGRGA